MKSKKKFLSLLVFAPLLVGCGNNVKKPKFAEYHNEVKTYEKFVEEMLKVRNKSSLFKEEKIGSLEMKAKSGYLYTREVNRGKEVIDKNKETSTSKGTGQYDAVNLIYKQDSISETEDVTEDSSGKDFNKDSYSRKFQFQTKDSKNGVTINLDSKEYELTSYSGYKPAEYFDGFAKEMFAGSIGSYMSEVLSHYSAEDKDDFKFYKDGNIFTVVETFEEKQEYEKSKYASKVSFTVQVDVTEGKWSTKYYTEYESTRTYKENEYARAKGDVVVAKEYESAEISVVSKKVSLKNLNLSKFKEAPKSE